MNLLITSLGSNTSIGVIKSLKSVLPSIRIIGCDINLQSECNGFNFADSYEQICSADSINYLESLKLLMSKHEIHCLIPIHDREIEVISKNKSLLSKYSEIIVNKSDIIELCNDKLKCSNFLSSICKVPKIYENFNQLEFPAIMKEIKGVGSAKIKILNSNHDQPESIPKEMLMQEFISGIEYTVDCYSSYLNHNFKCVVRKRKEIKNGMSIKGEIISHPQIEVICEEIHQNLRYVGVSNIQFIENENGIYFIEINPRFSGGGILTYKNGFNIPQIAINELVLNNEFDSSIDFNPRIGAKMVRYLQETFFDKNGNSI